MAFAKECNFYDNLKQNNTLDRLFQLCSRKMLFKTKGSVQPRATLPNQPPRTLDKLVQVTALHWCTYLSASAGPTQFESNHGSLL